MPSAQLDPLVGRVPASRVPACRKVLKQLRRLVILVGRVRLTRCREDSERVWCSMAFDSLTELIRTGDEVLPAHYDPRDFRRVRKSRPTANPGDRRGLRAGARDARAE